MSLILVCGDSKKNTNLHEKEIFPWGEEEYFPQKKLPSRIRIWLESYLVKNFGFLN